MPSPKFQLFKSHANSQWYFRLRASNNEIILSSEGYLTKQGCLNGISSTKQNALIDSRYTRRDLAYNYTFNLIAANGEIIGSSESYTTAHNRENGISTVKLTAPNAPIEDLN